MSKKRSPKKQSPVAPAPQIGISDEFNQEDELQQERLEAIQQLALENKQEIEYLKLQIAKREDTLHEILLKLNNVRGQAPLKKPNSNRPARNDFWNYEEEQLNFQNAFHQLN